jgi:hypothetical protein
MKLMGQRSTRMGNTVYRVVMPEETAKTRESLEDGVAKARALKSRKGGENLGKRSAKKA